MCQDSRYTCHLLGTGAPGLAVAAVWPHAGGGAEPRGVTPGRVIRPVAFAWHGNYYSYPPPNAPTPRAAGPHRRSRSSTLCDPRAAGPSPAPRRAGSAVASERSQSSTVGAAVPETGRGRRWHRQPGCQCHRRRR